MLRSIASLALALSTAGAALGAPAISPDVFRTTARFSLDTTELALTTSVATFEPHRSVQGYSWVHVYFYAFPLTPDDVNGVMSGTVAALDRKQLQTATTAR